MITVGLNNEYLEAEFYLRALTGNGLSPQDTTGAGSPGTVLVDATRPVTFSNPVIQSIAQQLADDELAHVRDVRATFASFGLTPPALPTIYLVNSFQLLTTDYTTTDNPQLVATIPTGELPHGIWPSGDGTRVYVALENGTGVNAIDTLTNQVIARISGGQSSQALTYVPGAAQPEMDCRTWCRSATQLWLRT